MAFITYKQADSRWGKKNYNGSSTMATAGCGPTACAMIAYAVDGKTTPLDTMKYMQSHGYAVRNQGTKWAGIPACLKAFGVKDVQNVPNMTKCWELMAKGYVGIFLFSKGKRGGITWTSSGHYIAVTDYKYQNGKHYVYTRDSGGRNHTGWYAYETTMKGLIPEIWLGKVIPPQPVKKPAGKYNGVIPAPTLKLGSKGDSVKNLQKFLNWYHPAWKLKPDGIFGIGTEGAVREFQRAEGIKPDGIYGKNSQGKANTYKVLPQSNRPVASTPTVTKPTTPAASTPKSYTGAFPDLVAHSGQKINYTAKDLSYAYGTAKAKYTYPKGKAKTAFTTAINKVYPKRSSWSKQCQAGASCDVGAGTVIRYSGIDANIPRGLDEQIPHLKKSSLWKNTGLTKTAQMKPGDVGVYIGKSKGAHIWIKVDGYTAEASHTNKYFMRLTKSQPTNSGKKTWGIYRATKASPISKGDRGTEVIKLQNFLNWAGFNCGKVDGIFGDSVLKALKAFQIKVGLNGDGIFGSGTLAKAKAFKR